MGATSAPWTGVGVARIELRRMSRDRRIGMARWRDEARRSEEFSGGSMPRHSRSDDQRQRVALPRARSSQRQRVSTTAADLVIGQPCRVSRAKSNDPSRWSSITSRYDLSFFGAADELSMSRPATAPPPRSPASPCSAPAAAGRERTRCRARCRFRLKLRSNVTGTDRRRSTVTRARGAERGRRRRGSRGPRRRRRGNQS